MAVVIGHTKYGMQLTLNDSTAQKKVTKTYNGFNVETDAGAADQFTQFVRGGGSIATGEENPGLVGLLGAGYTFLGLDMVKRNQLEVSE